MSITNEHVNNFFQVKSKETNNPDVPKINLDEVDILDTILENTEESSSPTTLDSNTKTNDTKKKDKDSDDEEEEEIETKPKTIDKIHEIDVTEQDIDKISSRQKRKETQIKLLIKIFKLLSFHVDTLEDLTNLTFPRETLLQKDNQKKLMDLIPQLKLVYNSSYLNCLHDNSIFKQKFPGVNLVRQVLKCHHLALTPKIISNGYEKATGKKKVNRIFKIEKQMF